MAKAVATDLIAVTTNVGWFARYRNFVADFSGSGRLLVFEQTQ